LSDASQYQTAPSEKPILNSYFIVMKKRSFLKLTSAALTGAALSPAISCAVASESESPELRNWAGNLSYHASKLVEPSALNEAREAILNHPKVRVLGTRHCFNRIADTDAVLLSTSKLNKILKIDAEKRTVTVEAGIRYGEFCKEIHDAGFAVHNLASLPHISVAGACSTATHGSGVANGNLATQVSAIEVITASGEVINFSRERDPELFNGVVVSLGCLGLITKVTLDLVPAFHVRQDVYLDLPMSQLEKNFKEVMSGAYSVSLFTDWQTDTINQVWKKTVTRDDDNSVAAPEYFGATLANRNVHPIIELSAENCTDQMGVPAPWYMRLPHFKMGFTPSSGEELQAEYFVPMESAVQAIQAVAELKEEIRPFILITEIRSIAADTLWMSPCYNQPSIAIHFTLKQDIEGVNNLLPKIEAKLAPYGFKPHWGKLFTLSPGVLAWRYSMMESFRKLVMQLDPGGKFRNEFIERNVFGVGNPE
jgi:xylitol oxidase